MAGLSRRADRNTHIWPGFVDALATLLMVIMFLLLVFVLAQFFTSDALSGRDQALTKLKGQVGELADLLSLERKENKDMRLNLSQLSQELQVSVALRDDLKTAVSNLRKRANTTEDKLSAITSKTESMQSDLASAQEKVLAQISELSGLNHDIAALRALKSELESKISKLASGLSSKEKEVSQLAEKLDSKDQEIAKSKTTFLREQELSKSARAEVALLNQQMGVLRQQLSKIQQALEISEKLSAQQNVQISSLGKRLNAALASKVQELSRYRSEFFGRLRGMLGKREGVRIVGDRFVFQSEVLFSKGSSVLGDAGKLQLDQLATTLLEIALEIPGEIDWILRIDGHTDNDPIKTARYPSNWELSTDRAISVVKHLTDAGLPANRLVAAGFGQHHPIDKRNDEIAKRRNRRIELKLTQR